MTAAVTKLNLDEALRYMGCPPERADPATRALAESCAGELLQAARPRWAWRSFDLVPEEGGVRFASPPDVLARSQGADHYDYTAGGGGLAQLYVEYDPEAQRFSFFHMDTGQPAARFTGRELYDFITEQGMWADGYIPVSGDFGRAAA